MLNKSESYNLIKTLEFPEPKKDHTHYEHTWQFQSNVAYHIEGWKKSKNLMSLDKDELLKNVVEKFKEMRNLLDTGNAKAFMDLNEKGYQEYFISHYYNKSEANQYLENTFEVYADQKGHMLPLEDYKLKFLGNCKLVTLERSDRKYLGEGVLIGKDKKENTLYHNYVILHIPSNSSDLEVARMRSEYGYLRME